MNFPEHFLRLNLNLVLKKKIPEIFSHFLPSQHSFCKLKKVKKKLIDFFPLNLLFFMLQNDAEMFRLKPQNIDFDAKIALYLVWA